MNSTKYYDKNWETYEMYLVCPAETINAQAAHGLWSLAGPKMAIHAQLGSIEGFWPVKYVRLNSFLVCDQGSLVGLCVQD